MELIGHVKNYEWGKIGSSSEVAQLAKLNSENFIEDCNLPYSELWMGDHPSGSSIIKSTGESLNDFLQRNSSDLIGNQKSLPYLFKVLSIKKALSIQVHPNKTEAETLHKEKPDIYKDPNHKPELAIALTPFSALCGFKTFDEIYKLLEIFKPLYNLIGAEKIENLLKNKLPFALKECYSALMTSKEDDISKCIEIIYKNYYNELEKHNLLYFFEKLKTEFPNDVGILSLFFFNIIKLNPGESIYLSANEPHAYLEGDCIECMACSDNVIRAGLTPKFKDINALLELLNYNGEPLENKIFKSIKKDDCYELFIPPVKDFAVGKLCISSDHNPYKLSINKYGSIILVLSGEKFLEIQNCKKFLKRGTIIFIPGNCGNYVEFHNNDSSESCKNLFVAYIAMYNDF